jgi:hypothetical protein
VLSPQSVAVRVRREIGRLAQTSRGRCLVALVHPEVAAVLDEDAQWTEAIARESGKTILVRARAGVHLERVSVLASDSVEAADLEAAAAQNGKGGALVWLEPVHGALEGPEEDNGEAWAPAPAGTLRPRSVLGRLRSWWAGRSAARRMALRR